MNDVHDVVLCMPHIIGLSIMHADYGDNAKATIVAHLRKCVYVIAAVRRDSDNGTTQQKLDLIHMSRAHTQHASGCARTMHCLITVRQ